MRVIAEGIETAAQMDLLKIFQCDLGQGYLFSPPVPASRVSEMLMTRQRGEPLELRVRHHEGVSLAIPGAFWETRNAPRIGTLRKGA
jgi:hypothetical protein